MSFGLLFWVIMILWILSWFGVWANYDSRIGYVNNLLLWILLALLGWSVFGPALHA